jgi:stress-induced morphogen
MTSKTKARWEEMRTDETRRVEQDLRKEFDKVDAYRYNAASIRVRVQDKRFKGKSVEQRDAMVEPHLGKLPTEIQADIMNLITLYPGEVEDSIGASLANVEFEDPSPSVL